jgi:hypothetical protein
MAGHVACKGVTVNAFRTLFWNRLVGRRRSRLEYNTKMDLGKIRYDGVGWIHLILDMYRWQVLVNTVIHLSVAKMTETFL